MSRERGGATEGRPHHPGKLLREDDPKFCIQPDECRAKEEKNPIRGGWGKRFLVTKNLGSLESVLKGEESNA